MTVEINNAAKPTPAAPEASVGQTTARGLAWMMGQTALGKVTTTATQIVLGWLLTKPDFGRIGLAMTVYAFPALLQQSGLRDVLTQRQQRYRHLVTPAFWLALCSGIVAGLLMLGAAPLAQAFYHKDIIGLVALLALGAPLESLATIPYAKLQVELRFRALAAIYLALVLANALLSMLFAWLGYGPYSVILPKVILAGLQAVALLVWTRPRIGMRLHLQLWRRLLLPLGQLLGISVCSALAAQGDYIALGLFHDEEVVGVYFFAFTIAAQTLRFLAGNVHAVIFPALSKLSSNPAHQQQVAFKTMRVVAHVAIPAMLLQSVVARPVMTIVFHHKWDAAIPIIQILSVGLMFDAVSWIAGALLQAQGRFRELLVLSFLASVAFVCVIGSAGYFFAGVGVAIAVGFYSIAVSQVFVLYSLSRSGLGLKAVVWMYLKPLCMGAIAVGAAASLATLTPPFKGADWLRVSVMILVAGSLYLLLLRTYSRDVLHLLSERVKNVLHRRSNRLELDTDLT